MAYSIRERDKTIEEHNEEADEFAKLPQKWRDKTIGKEAWDTSVEAVSSTISPEIKEGFSNFARTAAPYVANTWKGVREVEDWRNPSDVIAAGTARTIEGAGWLVDKFAGGVSQVTGIYRPWIDVADLFIPFTPGFASTASKGVRKGASIVSDVARQTVKAADPTGLSRARMISAGANLTENVKDISNILTSQPSLVGRNYAYATVQAGGPYGSIINKTNDLAPQFFEASSVRGGFQKSGTHPLSNLQKGTATRFNEMGVGRRAATHHIADVSPIGRVVNAHPQGNRILDKLRLEFNLPTGEDVANYVTAYDTINMKAYAAKLNKILKAFPQLNKRQVKDMLKVLPWEDVGKQRLTQKQLNRRIKELGRPDLAKDLTKANFPDTTLEPTLPKVYTDNTKKVVQHEFKNLDEWKKRWSILTGDPNADAQVRAIIRSVDNDPSLNIFSLDHMEGFHKNYDKLKSVQKLEAALADGSLAKMNVDKATELVKNTILDKRKIVTNYLDIKLQALDKKFPGFKQLSLEDQSKFMLDNANEVAKVLNWFEQPGLNRLLQDVSLKKLGTKKAARLKELFGLQDLPDPTNQIRFRVPNKPL